LRPDDSLIVTQIRKRLDQQDARFAAAAFEARYARTSG
jgi:hypothetical protein